MKNLHLFLIGAAGLALASCSQEELSSTANGDNFQLTVRLPENAMGTRALGDGLAATNLKYAVFEANGDNTFVLQGTGNFGSSLETTVSLNLSNGKSYSIAFFAVSSEGESVYNFDVANKQITVDYSKMQSAFNLADAYDCFYTIYDTGVISSSNASHTVVLNRPVAQINWGTDDLTVDAENSNAETIQTFGVNGAYLLSNLTVDAYTALDMLTGDVTGEPSAVAINGFASPAPQGAAFPIDNYTYVAMQYVLAPKTSDIYDLTLNISNAGNPQLTQTQNDVIVSAAPVQANFRTNIYGTLLGSNIAFNVLKNEIWGLPVYDVDLTVWDGKTTTYPEKNSEGHYYVDEASDIKGLADMVNGANGQTATDFSGETIVFASDFDMGSNPMPAIGSTNRIASSATGKAFRGVIDGKGHTISNLVVNAPTGSTMAAGLIANLDGADAAVRNLNFDNITVNAPNVEQAGAVVGILTNGATVSNVKVNSGKISSKEAAGGLVGRLLLNGNITDCENGASVSSTSWNAGGIVGAAYYTNAKGDMTISGCTNNGSVSSPTGTGGIVGLSAANVTGCTNNGKVSGSGSSVGGIVGEQKSAGKITDCVNTADIAVSNFSSGTYGTGGIVGWVRYDNAGYTRENNIEVSGCTNYASVSGNTGVGGIVGTWYMSGICKDNKNYAPKLNSASQFVAGIVGDSQWTGTMPNGFTEGNNLLTVTGNQSSTTQDNMTGGLKADFVYINDAARTTQSDNAMVDPQVAP